MDDHRHALAVTTRSERVRFAACGLLLPAHNDANTVAPHCPSCLVRAQVKRGQWQVTEHGSLEWLVHFVPAEAPRTHRAHCGAPCRPEPVDYRARCLLCPVCAAHALGQSV
ncbi:hypothetical protein GCM10027521_42170 [Amycolatopsis cihanbeyliensis]